MITESQNFEENKVVDLESLVIYQLIILDKQSY